MCGGGLVVCVGRLNTDVDSSRAEAEFAPLGLLCVVEWGSGVVSGRGG